MRGDQLYRRARRHDKKHGLPAAANFIDVQVDADALIGEAGAGEPALKPWSVAQDEADLPGGGAGGRRGQRMHGGVGTGRVTLEALGDVGLIREDVVGQGRGGAGPGLVGVWRLGVAGLAGIGDAAGVGGAMALGAVAE